MEMPTNPALTPSTHAWLAAAPDEALDAIHNPAQRQTVLAEAFRERVARTGVHSTLEPETGSARLKIAIAIRGADLRCRLETGTPLETIDQYLQYRLPGDPGKTAIYNHFRQWPYALLAARDAEHLWASTRRARGGNRKDDQFTPTQRERAVLTCSEQNGGRIPGKGEYERWQAHNHDMPTPNQVRGRRANGSCDLTWPEVQEACKQRALDEDGWDLTRLTLLVDEAGR